jgi:heme exporter protein D
MEEAGRHAVFIWSAYGLTALVVVALILRAFVDHRVQRRALARLEAAGVVLPGRERRRG